jgi:hypothetical protein
LDECLVAKSKADCLVFFLISQLIKSLTDSEMVYLHDEFARVEEDYRGD